jgi:hypothetical protein
VPCPPGDYAVSGGYLPGAVRTDSSGIHYLPEIISPVPTISGATPTTTGQTPDGWFFQGVNNDVNDNTASVWVVCQTPITVAGIGVPQFGSLYVAIALGAVVYFMVARRFGRRPTISAQI